MVKIPGAIKFFLGFAGPAITNSAELVDDVGVRGLLKLVGRACSSVASAGNKDSEGGATVTEGETRGILRELADGASELLADLGE